MTTRCYLLAQETTMGYDYHNRWWWSTTFCERAKGPWFIKSAHTDNHRFVKSKTSVNWNRAIRRRNTLDKKGTDNKRRRRQRENKLRRQHTETVKRKLDQLLEEAKTDQLKAKTDLDKLKAEQEERYEAEKYGWKQFYRQLWKPKRQHKYLFL